MAQVNYSVTTNDSVATLAGRVDATGGSHNAAIAMGNLAKAMRGGYLPASATVQPLNGDGVAAHGTFTFSGAASTNDTVLINGVTFTCVASSPSNNQFLTGAAQANTAANLAAAIRASTTALVNTTVTASDNGAGVCTVTAAVAGPMGNAVTIAKGIDSGSVNTVSGARLTSGANDSGTVTTLHFGI